VWSSCGRFIICLVGLLNQNYTNTFLCLLCQNQFLLNHSRICSWNQSVLRNGGKAPCWFGIWVAVFMRHLSYMESMQDRCLKDDDKHFEENLEKVFVSVAINIYTEHCRLFLLPFCFNFILLLISCTY